ncbi:hypothetical protein EJ06DRAFT_527276 [Trichodelitschia bisporula]|uniref:Uncharacterized protein n=1 Tax=Trichodelitschia bisporula TaxID=703511 RepID=A0A6G1I659_9PEZI|nr:hypothetical protein EJ06DRAFT_527276 [Trichodelitschia bisporula]
MSPFHNDSNEPSGRSSPGNHQPLPLLPLSRIPTLRRSNGTSRISRNSSTSTSPHPTGIALSSNRSRSRDTSSASSVSPTTNWHPRGHASQSALWDERGFLRAGVLRRQRQHRTNSDGRSLWTCRVVGLGSLSPAVRRALENAIYILIAEEERDGGEVDSGRPTVIYSSGSDNDEVNGLGDGSYEDVGEDRPRCLWRTVTGLLTGTRTLGWWLGWWMTVAAATAFGPSISTRGIMMITSLILRTVLLRVRLGPRGGI